MTKTPETIALRLSHGFGTETSEMWLWRQSGESGSHSWLEWQLLKLGRSNDAEQGTAGARARRSPPTKRTPSCAFVFPSPYAYICLLLRRWSPSALRMATSRRAPRNQKSPKCVAQPRHQAEAVAEVAGSWLAAGPEPCSALRLQAGRPPPLSCSERVAIGLAGDGAAHAGA